MVHRAVKFIDVLPKNGVGKVLRRALAEREREEARAHCSSTA